MWTWIGNNSAALGAVLSLCTAVIWIVYLQIIFASYKRQRRTRILIARGAGDGIESRCLISNMGAEPLYVVSIIATLHVGDRRITSAVTDLETEEMGEIGEAREGTNQGPLKTGEYMDIGRFADLMTRSAREAGASDVAVPEDIGAVELTVIGAYGADDLSVGATRHFDVVRGESGEWVLDPPRISTRQMRSRRDRRALERMLYEHR